MYTRSIYAAAAACTCACAPLRIRVDPHTRVRADRACLCGDPNEGRQASKLGRAAAARAAILLESGWKTSGADLCARTDLGPTRSFPLETGGDQVGAGCHVAGGEENKYLEWFGGGGGREGGWEGGGERDNRPVSEFLEWTRIRGSYCGSSGDRRR